ESTIENFARDKSQNVSNILVDNFLATERNDLVEKRLCIAHASFRSLDDVTQSAIINLDAFTIGNLPEVCLDLYRRYRSKNKLLAPRQNRCRQLMTFGSRHDEDDVRRRLLQNFQQGVEGRRRQHMDFVDDENLVPVARGGIFRAFPKLADVIHASV